MSIIFGVIIFLTHFFSDKLQNFYLNHRKSFSAFSGGIFISYLILYLFPAIYQVQGRLSKLVFLSVLSGVAIFFIIDRHISKHKLKYKVRAEIREEHAVSLFIYHILIGIAFISFSNNFLDLLIFFIPVVLFTAFSTLSMREVYEIERENDVIKAVLSTSTLIGIFLASVIPISRLLYFPLLGFIGGSIFYIIIKEVVGETERKPFYFVWGIILYSAFIGSLWLFL